MRERSAKERSTWNKHLRMRNSLTEQYTPGQNETLVMNCPVVKFGRPLILLTRRSSLNKCNLEPHWNLWQSPMFIQQSNKCACYPHFTAADPCWCPVPMPLALWTQLVNCPCPPSTFILSAQPVEYLFAWHHRGEKHGICVLTWIWPGQYELRALEDAPENRSADFSRR